MKTTPKKIYTRVAMLAHEKLKENSHKPDLLSLEFWELIGELSVEFEEFKLALDGYERNPNIETENRLNREAGDCMNYISAIIAKTDGYKKLDRGLR